MLFNPIIYATKDSFMISIFWVCIYTPLSLINIANLLINSHNNHKVSRYKY